MNAPAAPGSQDASGDETTDSMDLAAIRGPYALTGPMLRLDPATAPLRGDIAHIGLAGRCFVPHYAVPQPRAVMPGGAPLCSTPGVGSEEVCTLMEGDSFEVLDITGGWAWGCLSLQGPVGYVQIDRLEPLPG